MDITVILCTYNRGHVLAEALDSVGVSVLPESIGWEVLVVDNNSNDQTQQIVEEAGRKYPGRFRYLLESRPGKSYALNSGIKAACGEILAFMDDDVKVEPTWLQNLTANLHGEQWAGTGGRTLPTQAVTLPHWLSLDGPYALGGILAAMFDLGDEPLQLDQAPYGANMAFRKKMFEKYGGFRTDLGPSPNRDVPRPNEDTELGRRMMTAGERIRYEPSAIVYHPIPTARIEKQYFLTWWFDFGRAATIEVGKKPDVLGIPRHWMSIPKVAMTMLVPAAIKWATAWDSQKKFYLKCWMWMAAGQISEMHRQRHSPATR